MNDTKLIRDGKVYYIALHFIYKYDMTQDALRKAKKNGLPYIKEHGISYYNEQDFHDYYAGRIGNDVEKAGAM